MGAYLSLHPNAAVEPQGGTQFKTAFRTPYDTEPFRFLDLPSEIRYLIYEHLTHNLEINIPDLNLPGCIADTGTVNNCFFPSIMLSYRQINSEYTAISHLAMALGMCFHTFDVDDVREKLSDVEAHRSILPQRIMAQISRLDIRICTGRGWPHCGMLCSTCSIVSHLLALTCGIDYIPAIRNLFFRMTMMTRTLFTCSLYTDQLHESELNHPGEFDRYGAWIARTTEFFSTMTCARRCKFRSEYQIRCDLYCPWSNDDMHLAEEDIEYSANELVFGVCSKPSEATFRLHNLDVTLLGEEEVVDGD